MATWANQSKNTSTWGNEARNIEGEFYLLLENGDFLLQENGELILLESSSSWSNITKS